MPSSCATCSKETDLKCSRCKTINYCSKACQQTDRPIQKMICKTFSELDISTSPSQDHTLVVVLPENSQKPELNWLKNKWRTEGDYWDDNEEWLKELIDPSNTRETDLGRSLPVKVESDVDENKEEWAALYYDDETYRNGSLINKCARKLAPTILIRNTLVIAGISGPWDSFKKFRDISPVDFLRVAKYISRRGPGP